MVLFYIAVIFIVLVLLVYYGSQQNYDYWKNQKVLVPGPKPLPIFGNYKEYILLQKAVPLTLHSICKQFPKDPYIGVFFGPDPTLIVQDPELLRLVYTKDFYYFNGREVSDYNDKEIITRTLFFSHGDRWKVVRQNLTPMFSSSKLKNMFHLIENCCFVYEKLLDDEFKISDTIEMRSLMARYTIDCIGACAFGVNTNVMEGGPKNNKFREIADAIIDCSYLAGFVFMSRAIWPYIFYSIGLKTFPNSVNDFFNNLMTGVFKERQYKPSSRNDFVDHVLSFKNQKFITGDAMSNLKTNDKVKVNIEVDDNLLIAQCLLFFAAGFETSASSSSYTLFELAKNQEAQEKAYNEVCEYLKRNNNKLSYSCTSDLPYLEACMDEALRLHPVLGNLTREVMEDYTFPNGIFMKKGTRIHIPVYTIHHNEEHFPNAEKFQPERFLGENKQNIKPYTYMPFGEGPRICIGIRFAKMQSLSGLATVLKKYKLELAKDMPKNIEYEAKTIIQQPKGGIRLKLTPREGWESRVFSK